MLDIERLRQIALAAPAGPWHTAPCKPDCPGARLCTYVRTENGQKIESAALREYAAAFDPPTVLELLGGGTLQTAREKLEKAIVEYKRAEREIDALIVELGLVKGEKWANDDGDPATIIRISRTHVTFDPGEGFAFPSYRFPIASFLGSFKRVPSG